MPSTARHAARNAAREAAAGRRARLALAVLAVFAAVAASGCAQGEGKPVTPEDAHAAAASRRAVVAMPTDVTPPGVTVGAAPYVVRPVADGGRIVGTVRATGALPADGTITPDSAAARVCGATFPERALSTRGGGVAGAAVWLVDIRSGKPLPTMRRHALALARCALTPRLLTVPAGGALLVNGQDAMPSRIRFARFPGGLVVLESRMTGAGQVIPSAAVVAEPGAVEARGLDHPWLRAWVLAFDHPYFATTDASGAFALDSVPPGSYTLVAWHERLGRVEQRVTVGAGAAAEVTVELGARE